jgi:mono/diheme cytochrome c family protein
LNHDARTRDANVMPPWGDSIPDDEIWRIVAYIKSLSLDFKGPIEAPATEAPAAE